MKLLAALQKHKKLSLTLMVGVTFLLLYHRFIFGDAVFMYTDGGSDSFSSSYPIITLLARMFGAGDFSFYQLSYGLGGDFSAVLLQYLNPIKLLLLLAGGDRFPYAILLFLFVQYELIALFGYDYFRRLLKHEAAAFLPAFLWTFVSYGILWGQNYSFGTCLLLFTIVMDALQAWLTKNSRRRFLILVLALALFLLSNYYFFYMSGLFSIIYVVFYTLFTPALEETAKEKGKRLLGRLLGLGVAALFAVFLCAAPLRAITASFFGSTRAGSVGTSFTKLFRPFSLRRILSCFARLLSTDLLKSGNRYTGAANYYEIAVLFTSALFVFALLYLLCKKGYRAKTLLLLLLCTLALALPLSGQLFNMSSGMQRYSFLIAFLEVVTVGYFTRSLLLDPNRRALLFSIIGSPLLAAAFTLFLWRYGNHFSLSTSGRAMLIVAASFVIWALILLSVTRKAAFKAYALTLIAFVLMIEIVIANYASLYLRDYVTKEAFQTNYYHDGTDVEVAHIKESDSSLYRISTDTAYNFANEGMVDDFYGTTVYSSTVSESLVNLSREHSLSQLSSNFFIMGYEQYYLFTLLGGKYMIVDADDLLSDDMEVSLFFENSFEGRARTYVNKNALPFAYLYEDEITKSDYLAADPYLRQRLLTQTFYRTNADGTPGADSADAQGAKEYTDAAVLGDRLCQMDTRIDLAERVFDTNAMHFEVNEDGQMTAVVDDTDPYFIIDLAAVQVGAPEDLQFLSIAFDPQSLGGNQLFELFVATQTRPTIGLCFDRQHYFSKEMNSYAFLLPEGATILRFDLPDGVGKSYRIEDFSLINAPTAAGDFDALKASPVTNASFDKNSFHAHVENSAAGNMLCIPLLYHKNWSAKVNGEAIEIENINGGLCGVRLPAGTLEVELSYALPHFRLAAAISLVSLLLWLILFIKKKQSTLSNLI